MNVTFLGTGTSQGIPVITCDCEVCKSDNLKDKRLRSSVLIETKNKNFVIDTGPDFRQQMLRENVQKLDAILFTHHHKDHIAGLDDIRAYNYKQKKYMQVYGNQKVIETIKREFAYSFDENKYPGVPDIELNLLNGEPFEIDNIKITPIKIKHYKLDIYGYKINDLTYITDASFIEDAEMEKFYKTKVLIINALRIKSHISHFNLQEALQVIQHIKPEKAYLTHISHYLGFHDIIQNKLPENVFLGYDGLKISLNS